MGWGTEDAAGAGGREEGEAAAVEVTAGEEQNEKVWLAAALGCVSQKALHWLSRREALHFHSAQVVSVGRKTVLYVNCLQRPNWQPEHAFTIVLKSAMNLTHKNQVFHYDTRGRIKSWNSESVPI